VSSDRESQDGIISLFAGVGVGVIVGAAVALLLAPQAGEQTRAQIRDSAEDAMSRLRTSMDDLKTRVEELAHRGGDAPGAIQADAAGATNGGESSGG
jgi:gas vesicle protein